MEVSQNSQLYGAFAQCSQRISDDHSSSPFERYIANSFLSNNPNEFVHIRGSAQEKNSLETDFTVLNLKSINPQKDQALDLAKKISSANADMVCIQEVSVDDAHDVYDVLQGDYAHFLYLDVYTIAHGFPGLRSGGMLIASKCRIEKAQFNRFPENSNDFNEGFFDFVIKNGEKLLGHIYATNLKEDSYKGPQVQKFVNLIERIQEDILKMEEELITFVLCGDFKTLQSSEEGRMLRDTYFRPENNHIDGIYALLLESIPAFPHEVLSPDYSILNTSAAMIGDNIGFLTLLKKESSYSFEDILKNIGGNYWNENYTILCGGRADVSAGKDSSGNASVEGGVTFSGRSDSGIEYSAGASVEVKRDNDGNVTTEGKVEGTIKW